MKKPIITIDFHVTSECNQECSYCWGPLEFEKPMNSSIALRIIDRVKELDIKRIVFTGGDPLKRNDIGILIRHAKEIGLEVALSTTGDELTAEFLESFASFIDLISLPLDGASEEINARTKKPGHFAFIMKDLELLRSYPGIDVKLCTPVTSYNLTDVWNIFNLIKVYARTTKAFVFYNIFQVFPRSMKPCVWDKLLVSGSEFGALEKQLIPLAKQLHCNFLNHDILDCLYIMIFPDGQLVIPNGPDFRMYGQFLEIKDMDAVITVSQFDVKKHIQHSLSWEKKKLFTE